MVLTRHLAAGALIAVGLSAFLYHASLTAWTARLDGIIVAGLVGTLFLHGLARTAQVARGRGPRPGIPRLRLAPWLLLTLGAVCWWLGQSGGPWCRPDSPWQAHAAWHLLAAAALALWLSPAGARPEMPGGSSLREERPTNS